MLIITAKYKCLPGKRSELFALDSFSGNIAGTRKEHGNLYYDHVPARDDKDTVFVLEEWEDEPSLNAHRLAKHHKAFRDERAPMLVPNSYEITIYNAEVNEARTASSRKFVKEALNPTIEK